MGNLSFLTQLLMLVILTFSRLSRLLYMLYQKTALTLVKRETSTQRRFGGMRFGGDPQDPDSQENDLDIVNYDIGNVNPYLHSGSGNINSIGEFRFIYGKTDRIPTTINKNGRLRVNVNSNPLEPSICRFLYTTW